MEFRGTPTNRKLEDGGFGTLDLLCLKRSDLVGKKVLDIGIGGGRALQEALEIGLDVIGFDILPTYRRSDLDFLTVYPEDYKEVAANIDRIKRTSRKFPGRVVAGDATERLPFANNTFDMVMSCYGVPEYAQNRLQASRAIAEMIRVAREKVIFTKGEWGWSPFVNYGLQGSQFKYNLFGFLEEVKRFGGSYRSKRPWLFGPQSIHIDVSKLE